jgi:hypothetical protein
MQLWRIILGTRIGWARYLAAATGIGVFFALIGPFGSYEQPFLQRLIYCVGVGWAGAPIFYPGLRVGLHLGHRWGWPTWVSAPAVAALLCLPIAAMVTMVRPILLPNASDPLPPAMDLVLGVAMVVMPITLAGVAAHRFLTPPAGAPAPAGPARPKFLERVPARLGEQVLALEAEDHYVRVHTALGSTLILMRFADAIAEMDGADGLKTHRSWWVAKSAVRNSVSRGRRMDLVLDGGLTVPVTREAASQVRRANWV